MPNRIIAGIRATCPKCGRENTPLKKSGREFKAHFPRGGGEWCYGPREEEMYDEDYDEDYDIQTRTSRRMTRAVQGDAEKHEKRAELLLEQAQRELERAEEARQLYEKFGSFDDYPDETVLFWKRNFTEYGMLYTYSALKVNGAWYLTGTKRTSLSHEELVVKHLRWASEVWYVHTWEKLA